MSYRITERSLYKPISNILSRHGAGSVNEVRIVETDEQPDLVAEFDGQKFVIEVKINREAKLLEDIPRAWLKSRKINAQGFVSMLFPSNIKEIHPDILDSVAPKLEITTAIVALPWATGSQKKICLEDFAKRLEDSYRVYVKTKAPLISYDDIVDAAREAVVEIASTIRQKLVSQYVSDAMAIVGRFDIYQAELRDLGVKEEETKAWIADIAAYLVVNQLLFYHILSQKTTRYPHLPEVNPDMPDEELISNLKELFSKAAKDYEPVFGPDLLSIIKRSGGLNSLRALSKYIIALKALRPEHVRSELLGRLYQESIPPEARKNLGAFFTKPRAATILATLAIDRWDEKVLDPACGSGTLLTEAYRRKKKLAPLDLSDEELHERLLSDIYGIDIMHFAHHMTSINLLAQNLTVSAELRNIRAGDGLEPMILSISSEEDDPPMMRLADWMESVRPEKLPHESFDVVIMNPPFTRRERLSEVGEIARLEKLFYGAFEGEVVRGKVGYWAYFMAAATNMVKPSGKLAMVTPEEFFAGGSAESLRRYIFFGEVFKKGKYVPVLPLNYTIDYIVRSSKEVAFSETALYRDYLVVFRKIREKDEKPMIFAVLKKPLNELVEEKVATEIKEFAINSSDRISTDGFEAIKIYNVNLFLKKHIDNLKPIVGFNTIEAQRLFLELIAILSNHPTLIDFENQGVLKIRVYNPGQYRTKGVENEARRLFIRKYGERGEALFEYAGKNAKSLRLRPIGMEKTFEISFEDVIPALRTYAGVKKISITSEKEYAIVNPKRIPSEIRKIKGMLNIEPYIKAANDIKSAYENLAGRMLLTRKVRLTSPNLYWLAYCAKDPVLGTTSAFLNLRILNLSLAKEMAIYLNSSFSLLQLLGFAAETEGAWITLHGDQVWKHVHVPEFNSISGDVHKRALRIFDKIAKQDIGSLFNRLKNKDPLQREIDLISLEMLGLGDWKDRLDDLYTVIVGELEAMLEILKRSEKLSKMKSKINEEEEKEENQIPLGKYF